MASPVTDPALLAQLNGGEGSKAVSDPALLAQLNETPSIAGDVAKSAGIGVAKSGIGIAGAAGDLRNMLSSGVDFAADKMGVSPEATQTFKDTTGKVAKFVPGINAVVNAPTSSDIQKGIEKVTGEFYKPKTTAGEYAQTVGEFAPMAINPELLAGKLPSIAAAGKGLLTRVLAPAVSSETAGQVTKGTAAEPYARVAGAVAGGSLASALTKAKTAAAPTVEELKDSYRAKIDHPDVQAVTINPNSLTGLHSTIRADLEKRGFRARRETNTFSDIDELSNASPTMARAAGAPASIADVESVRKSLGKTAQELGPDFRPTPDAAAATAAVKHIDRWLDNLKQPDLLSGDISRAAPLLKDARGDYAAAMRAENLQNKVGNASLNAGSSYSGGNINNATRQALKPLAKNDFAKAGGYSDAEKAALSKSIMGSTVGNAARSVGKLAPDSGLKALHHIGAAVASLGASVPASLASLAAKIGGDMATTRNVRKLDEMLRARSPLHQENLARVNNPTIASKVTPGVTLPNPNYVAPQLPGPGRGTSALINALLSSSAPRLQSP